MKVIVTGAAGKLGQEVCKVLASEGHEITGVDRSHVRDFPGTIKVADLTNREVCYAAMEGVESLIHLANMPHEHASDAQSIFNHNVTANMNVFQAAYELGVHKIIFASSIHAIGADRTNPFGKSPNAPQSLPLDESAPAFPQNTYALSKVAGEMQLEYFARMAGISTVAIRFPWLMERLPLYVVRHPPPCFAVLHRIDAARLVSAALATSLPGYRVYLPSSNDLVDHWGGIEKVVAQYYADVPKRTPKLTSLIDNSRITEETGWTPVHRLNPPPLERAR